MSFKIWSDYKYKVENNEAVIYKYMGNDEEVTVPNIIDGFPVTKINASLVGDCGFCNSDTLKRVIIPEGVEEIPIFSFSNSKSLENVTIPASVTEISGSAFNRSRALTNISVNKDNPKYADVDGILFSKDKTELIYYPQGKANEHYKIPAGVTKIGYGAFAGCPLKSVTIPGSVAKVSFGAFQGCRNLQNVTLMPGVQKIDFDAFENCAALTDIAIPASVTEIDMCAFNGCTSLVNIDVDENNMKYSDFNGALYDKNQKKLIYVPLNNEFAVEPAGLTEYGRLSHGGNKRFTHLNVSATITNIHPEAFDGCEALQCGNHQSGSLLGSACPRYISAGKYNQT